MTRKVLFEVLARFDQVYLHRITGNLQLLGDRLIVHSFKIAHFEDDFSSGWKRLHQFINKNCSCSKERPILPNNMKFTPNIYLVVEKGCVGASPNGVLSARNAEDVTIYVCGYTDYKQME